MAKEVVLGVVGCGTMGRGIVQLAAQSGIAVVAHDVDPARLASGIEFVNSMLERAVEKGRMRAEDAAAAKARISGVDELKAFSSCDIVVEAIAENLEIKQALFRDLEGIVTANAILATNTSSLAVTAIAAVCQRPQRVAGLHFFNPVPLMKVVEVIGGVRTAPHVLERLERLVAALGHRGVRAKDSPGFLINHAGRGLLTEGLRILQEGVADAADVDRIMREAAGFRMGPFELLDLTGLDISAGVMDEIYGQFYHEPRFRPSPLSRLRVAAGLYGRKVDEGFYRYSDGRQQVPAESPITDVELPPIWLSHATPEWGRSLHDYLAAAGVALDCGATPNLKSLCLTTPAGADATTTALRENLDPKKSLAIDMLLGLDGRKTIMGTPVTDPTMLAAARALFARDGKGVCVIQDSPGFVAQRILVAIVNIGCDIAQQRIATPNDIDDAVCLGLGYPMGPLALGDQLGPPIVLSILEEIFAFTGDPRYRPSAWLKRRALLDCSLKTVPPTSG